MTTTESLAAALSDRYRIERELGAGGMATVYLAHDLKHDRNVAIKVLKPELAAVLGAERFVVEIKTTAALQHPHILPLFDSGSIPSHPDASGASGGPAFLYYVMPYIQGETIREKLNRETQFGVGEAVRIACEVADALDYAHRHGVIHRDIKPENILLHDGRAMVMDFGIAIAVSAAAGGRMTETGLSLGTPHYMSPEQATAEREITARSDVYSLGSVLYEMLAGDPPFTASSAQAVIMKIITELPAPIATRRKSVPSNVAAAVAKALEKLSADRFENAKAFADALTNVHYRGDTASVLPALPLRGNWPALALGAIAAAATVVAAWSIFRGRDGGGRVEPLMRFAIALPDSQALTDNAGRRVAFSPNGREFVYVGPGKGRGQLWLRSIGALDATPIPGSDGATNPSFSPDGESIAYLTFGPFTLKTIPRIGGQARILLAEGVSGGGLDWGPDGFIYFDAGSGLSRIRADGTGRQSLFTQDSLAAIAWPAALPNGRGVLVRVRRLGESAQQYTIDAVDLRNGTRKHVVQALVARYLPGGFLLYVSADGSLFAQRFDQDRLELTGAPLKVWNGVSVGTFGASDIAISPSGDLLYTAGTVTDVHRRAVWVTRNGTIAPVDSPAVDGLITSVALSPDASSIALGIAGPTAGEDIWVKHLGGGPMSQVTRGGGLNWAPVWSPDGRDLLFFSDHDGAIHLYRQRSDGSTAAVPVLAGVDVFSEIDLGSDGRTMVVRINRAKDNGDFYTFRAQTDSAMTPLMPGPALERTPALSPDRRWLAYASDESGQSEVYVRPFPAVDSARIQVSTNGGTTPRWSHAGNELFYQSATSDLMSSVVRRGSAMSFLPPTRLFSLAQFWQWTGTGRRWYDVAPDDQRFLMITAFGTAQRGDRLVHVSHLRGELARRLPAK